METQSKKPQTLLAILALIGMGLSIQLTQHYFDIRSGVSGFKSFCNISSAMNCDAVAASPYSEIFTGFPLSTFGAGWYLALLIVALIARNRFWRRDATRFAFVMTVGIIVGTYSSVYVASPFALLWEQLFGSKSRIRGEVTGKSRMVY